MATCSGAWWQSLSSRRREGSENVIARRQIANFSLAEMEEEGGAGLGGGGGGGEGSMWTRTDGVEIKEKMKKRS